MTNDQYRALDRIYNTRLNSGEGESAEVLAGVALRDLPDYNHYTGLGAYGRLLARMDTGDQIAVYEDRTTGGGILVADVNVPWAISISPEEFGEYW